MTGTQPHIVPGDVSLLDAALAYAKQGVPVFPLHNPLPDSSCSCGNTNCGSNGKHPCTKNGLNDATTDSDQIRKWWATRPDANIGIPTGASSGLVVVDVDGAEGSDSLRRMAEKHGPLPSTKTAKTGKGYHLYFKHPGVKVKSKAPLCADYPHVDSRSDGGYVVAPPSLHYSGESYVLDQAAPHELAELPPWLIALINGKSKADHQIRAAANDEILDGSRNSRLASLAGSMRARGMTQEAIEAALLMINQQQCSPPLPDEEVQRIAHSIASYAPGTSDRTLNDAGNADRFAQQWGSDVAYVPQMREWLVWDGTHWRPDAVGAVMEMAKVTAFKVYEEGTNVTDTHARDRIVAHSKISQQAPRLKAMLELAQSIPALVVPIEKLDANPWLLGVANGTVDLRSGELVASVREDYITKVSPVTFDRKRECPAFIKFVQKITGGDEDLLAYLKRVVGYMLTGRTTEQCLFYLYGTGANGKSTFLNVCKALLGTDLCRQTPVETIMVRGGK